MASGVAMHAFSYATKPFLLLFFSTIVLIGGIVGSNIVFAQTTASVSQDQVNAVQQVMAGLGLNSTSQGLVGIDTYCGNIGNYLDESDCKNVIGIKNDLQLGGQTTYIRVSIWSDATLAANHFQTIYYNETNPDANAVYFGGQPQVEKFEAGTGNQAFDAYDSGGHVENLVTIGGTGYNTGLATGEFQCGVITGYIEQKLIPPQSFIDSLNNPNMTDTQRGQAFYNETQQLRVKAAPIAKDWLTKVAQTLSSNNLCGAAPKHLPIIFIPGVAGTYLDFADANGQTINIWPITGTSTQGSAYRLLLQGDGATSSSPLESGQSVVANRIFASHGLGSSKDPFNFYGGFEDYLVTNEGYTLGKDLVEFPYDWRLDNQVHLAELDKLVNQVRASTGQSKVILIAHSMGGIIGKAYVDSIGASKVDTLITIGTPFFGAVKPYYALVNGYTFGNPFISPLAVKILAQNSSAVYELCPWVPFVYDYKNKQDLTLDQSFQMKYKDVKTGYLVFYDGTDNIWSPNTDLIQNAKNFHNLIGTKVSPYPLPSGVKHYVIIGTGVTTLDGFVMADQPPDESHYIEILGRHVKLIPHLGDGDGTVPMFSSQISGVTKTYYVPYQIGASSEHGSLTDNVNIQKIVKSILDGNPSDYYTSYSEGALTEKDSTDFTIHSNVQTTIVDETTGNKLGYNNDGGIDETIPGGTFLSMDGGTYAHISDVSDTYKVILNGTNNGKFTLITNVTKSGQSTVFSYNDVPVQQGTIAQLEISPSQASSSSMPTLQVNSNGQESTVSATAETGLISPAPSTPPTPTTTPSAPPQAQSFTSTPDVVNSFLSGNSIAITNQNTNSQLANYITMQSVPDKYAQQVLGIQGQFVTTVAYQDRYGRPESNNNLNVFLQLSHTTDKINSMRGVELGGDSIMTNLSGVSGSTSLVNSAEIQIPQGSAGNVPQKIRDTLNTAIEPANTSQPVLDFLNNNIDLVNKVTGDHLTHYILVQTVPDLYAQKILNIQGQYVSTLAFEDRYGRQDSNGNLNVFLQISHTADQVNSIRGIQLGGDDIEVFVNGVDEGTITKTVEIPMSSSSTTQMQSSETTPPAPQLGQNTLPAQSQPQSPPPTAQSANGYFKMDKSEYSSSANPPEMATITGKLNDPKGGTVVLTITKPDGTTEPISADVTNVGDFTTLVIIDESFPAGTYTISGNYHGSDLGSTTFTVR